MSTKKICPILISNFNLLFWRLYLIEIFKWVKVQNQASSWKLQNLETAAKMFTNIS